MSKIVKLAKEIRNILFRKGFNSTQWKNKFCYFGENSVIIYPGTISKQENISIGKNVTIFDNSRLQNFESFGWKCPEIVIEDDCYIGSNFTILNASKVIIEKKVLIASNVIITSENHGIDPENEIPYMNQPLVSKPVKIGEGCWIGEKVCILPGVSIGKKSIIGAGSIVTKSVPDFSIVAGNPAKIIKQYDFEKHEWRKI